MPSRSSKSSQESDEILYFPGHLKLASTAAPSEAGPSTSPPSPSSDPTPAATQFPLPPSRPSSGGPLSPVQARAHSRQTERATSTESFYSALRSPTDAPFVSRSSLALQQQGQPDEDEDNSTIKQPKTKQEDSPTARWIKHPGPPLSAFFDSPLLPAKGSDSFTPDTVRPSSSQLEMQSSPSQEPASDADRERPPIGQRAIGRASGARLLSSSSLSLGLEPSASSPVAAAQQARPASAVGTAAMEKAGQEGSMRELTRRASAEEAGGVRARATKKVFKSLGLEGKLGSPFQPTVSDGEKKKEPEVTAKPSTGGKDTQTANANGTRRSPPLRKPPPVALLSAKPTGRARSASDASTTGSISKDIMLERLADALRTQKRRAELLTRELMNAEEELEQIEAERARIREHYQARITSIESINAALEEELEELKKELIRAENCDDDDARVYYELMKDNKKVKREVAKYQPPEAVESSEDEPEKARAELTDKKHHHIFPRVLGIATTSRRTRKLSKTSGRPSQGLSSDLDLPRQQSSAGATAVEKEHEKAKERKKPPVSLDRHGKYYGTERGGIGYQSGSSSEHVPIRTRKGSLRGVLEKVFPGMRAPANELVISSPYSGGPTGPSPQGARSDSLPPAPTPPVSPQMARKPSIPLKEQVNATARDYKAMSEPMSSTENVRDWIKRTNSELGTTDVGVGYSNPFVPDKGDKQQRERIGR